MGTCKVCNEECEDKYFDAKQNKCILHCEKDNAYQIDDNNSKLFYYALIDYITSQVLRASKEYKTSIGLIDHLKTIIWNYFDNLDNNDPSFNIKEVSQNKITLEDIIFPIYNFTNNEYNYTSILNKLTNIEFKNCNFKYKIYLKSDTNLIFRECTFSGNWYHIFCKEIKYIECTFEDFIIDNILEDKKTVENHLLYNCGFKNIRCSGTIFKKRFFKFDNINKYKKIENIKLINCEFDEDFILNITDNENKKDLEYFEITNINFEHSIFHRKVKIQFCTIKEKASFFNTSFKDLADFYRTQFNKVVFKRTDFEQIAVFSEAEFSSDIDFKYTKFLGKSIFRDTIIKGKLNLRDTIFDDDATFLDITSEKRKTNDNKEFYGEPKVIKVANRETARIIKNFYDGSNNIIEANKFYKLEMLKREEELDIAVSDAKNDKSELWSIRLDKIIFQLHNITSEHSQNWFLALKWIFIFGLIYALFSQKNINIDCWSSFVGLLLISPIIINFVIDFSKKKTKDKYFMYINMSLYTLFIITVSVKKFDYELLIDVMNPLTKPIHEVTMVMFIFKVIIAYLIYQFIVSVRQNTRRK